MNRNLKLDYEIHSETINSETVINFFDKFSTNLEKHTVVVMDRASIHTSDALLEKLSEWVDGGQPRGGMVIAAHKKPLNRSTNR